MIPEDMNTGGRVATVGTFDGVHTGHLAVLSTVERLAAEQGLNPMVITFDRHPLDVIAPERAPKRLMSPADEAATLADLGLEVMVIPFTRELMGLSAREWMQLINREMGVKTLVVGYDNTFGRDGVDMSVADYKRLGSEIGLEVVEAPIVPGVSSSAIRRRVREGDVASATKMLGRPYSLDGTVVEGNRIGRTIGFPTANLKADKSRLIPANGVYAATAVLPDGSRHRAVVNIGVRPTVGEGLAATVEAHIIDWEGDLYGKPLTLEFTARIRDERRFDSLEALKHQIDTDVAAALTTH